MNRVIVIEVEVSKKATEAQIDAFIEAVRAQVEDLEDADGNWLGDLPVVKMTEEVTEPKR
jgi:hypothetical protein